MQTDDPAFEGVPLGRSLEELTTPRPRLMPPVEIFDGMLLEIESSLRRSVPEEIRKRIGVTRNVAVYGAFCYDFFTVSVYWSFTCIDMALWEKFLELNPGKRHQRLTLGPLLNWASQQRLLPPDLPPDAIRKLRNSFAHPKEFDLLVAPGMAVDVFVKTVEIVNHLWPLGLG